MENGRAPHERRLGEPYKRPVCPFGAMVECHPISAKDQSRLHQFGEKVQPGTFLRSHTENSEASEILGESVQKKHRRHKGMNILGFPRSRWNNKIVRKKPRIPELTLRREPPVGSEDLREDLQGNSERFKTTGTKDDAAARRHIYCLAEKCLLTYSRGPKNRIRIM